MRPVADSRGIELVVGRQAAAEASGDPRRLAQILSNLISNAVKFTPSGGRVTMTTSRRGIWVSFLVRDTGIGIDREFQEQIFEEFYQVQSEKSSQPVEGTGLGLALSRQLARAMGGDLTVRSRPQSGSTFELRLPKH